MSKMCYDPESKPQASLRPSFLSKTWTSGEYMFPGGHGRYQQKGIGMLLGLQWAPAELLLPLHSHLTANCPHSGHLSGVHTKGIWVIRWAYVWEQLFLLSGCLMWVGRDQRERSGSTALRASPASSSVQPSVPTIWCWWKTTKWWVAFAPSSFDSTFPTTQPLSFVSLQRLHLGALVSAHVNNLAVFWQTNQCFRQVILEKSPLL